MVALVEKSPGTRGATREAVRRETAKPKPGRAKAVIFNDRAATKLQTCSCVPKTRSTRRVIDALEAIVKELRAAK